MKESVQGIGALTVANNLHEFEVRSTIPQGLFKTTEMNLTSAWENFVNNEGEAVFNWSGI